MTENTDYNIIKTNFSTTLKLSKTEKSINFNVSNALKGDFIESIQYSKIFEDFDKDYQMFSGALSDFNSKLNSIIISNNQLLNSIYNQLKKTGAYIDTILLLNGQSTHGTIVIDESFNKTDDITDNTLFVDVDEGFCSLPIESNIAYINNDNITYKESNVSNGYFTEGHLLNMMFDDSPVSYCEYRQSGVEELILEIDLDFKLSTTLNTIELTPINFTVANPIMLEGLYYSIDGINYNQIASRRLLQDNNSEVFSITFLPIITRYLKIKLSQSSKDLYTNDFRIGLSNFKAGLIKYGTNGSLVISKDLIPNNLANIDAISIFTDELFFENKSFPIKYQVSFNNKDYYPISPVNYISSPNESLIINNEYIPDSVSYPDKDFSKLYIKIDVNKSFNAANIKKIISTTAIKQTETFKLNDTVPYRINLSREIAQDSLTVNLISGLRTGDTDKKKEIGKIISGQYTYMFDIPEGMIGIENVYIGEDKITKKLTAEEMYSTTTSAYYIDTLKKILYLNIYSSDKIQKTLKYKDQWIEGNFASGTSTSIPPENDELYVTGTPILISLNSYVVLPQNSNRLALKLKNDNIKENIRISYVEYENGVPKINETHDIILAGVKTVKLSYLPIKEESTDMVDGYEVKFINGHTEFAKATEYAYSIDYDNGVLYLRDAYSDTVSITYKNYAGAELSNTLFEVYEGQYIVIDPLVFNKEAYYSIEMNVMQTVDAAHYTITNDKTIDYSSSYIQESRNDIINPVNSTMLFEYMHEDRSDVFFSNIFPYISPLIYNIKALCSIEQF